jgi:S1-C subfamily serine protease
LSHGGGVRAGRVLGAAAVAAALTVAGVAMGLAIARQRDGPGTPGVPQPRALTGPAQPVQWTEAASGARYYSSDERNNIAIYDALNEGVVNVAAVGSVLYRYRPIPRSDSGSGVIIDTEGHVLTSHHVIRNATRLTITLWDGSEHDAALVGADPENDLAVIRFEPGDTPLTVIPFGDSTDLRVGQKVLAIGNPFGQDRSLTTGIVSGLGRPVEADDGRIIQEMIQTDASINPGNSGGPLLDAGGRMIGINTMIFSPTGASVGIGFAVPVATARRVLPELMEHGTVRRGWIDIRAVAISARLARELDLTRSEGLLVHRVEPDSPAAIAGLRGGTQPVRWGRQVFYAGGDIIVEVDGHEVSGYRELLAALEDNKPGDVVTVVVERDGRLRELSVTLSERTR